MSGAVQYQVWRGGTRVAQTTGTSFTEPSPPAEGTYGYRVSAFDAAGNESARSRSRSILVDRTAPPAPALTISSSPSAAKPVLNWSSVRDARSGVTGYKVYRNGTFVKPTSTATSTTSSRTRTFTDTGAAEGTITYAVAAIDAAGNEGPLSVARTYVLDVTPPARPLLVSAATPTNTAPVIVWPAVAGAAGYVVRRGGVALGRVATTSYTDGASLAEGAYAYDVAATDAAGNTSAASDAVTVTIDRTPPGVVTGLAGPALTRLAPHLTWTAVSGAATYRVYRDGARDGSTAATAFDDAALTAEGAHDYAVAAVDAAGNEGARSVTVTVTFDVTPPPTPALPAAVSPTRAKPVLAWQASSGAATYSVRRDGAVVGTTAATSFTDGALAADGTYLYTVTALDAAGNESAPQPQPVTVAYDTTPPAVPAGLDGATPTNAVPALSWQPATGAVGYRLQRDGAVVGETAATALSDSALVPVLETAPPDLHPYTYRVVAIDAAGNESAPSDPRTIAVDLRSTENPTLLDAPSPTRTAPSLRWTFLAAAARYRVLRDGAAAGETTATTFSDATLATDGAHAYVVVALRPDGSELGRSTPRTVVRDTSAPLAPTGVTAPARVNRPPTISWDAGAEAAAYRVLRDGAPVGETTATSFTDGALVAEGSYAYTVLAVDAAGNASSPSAARTVVLRTTPPAAPAGLVAASPTRAAPALSWVPVAGADHYVVRRGAAIVATPSAAAFTDALPADGTYGYRVAAVDDAGNEGTPSATLAVVVDTTPPAAPAAPSAPVLTSTAPVLTWPPVAGASGYAIRRGGTVIARVGDVATFTDTLAGADGTLTYDLIAVDAAGNESAPSPGTDVVLDRTAPATPAGVVAPSPTATSPYLTWGAVAGAVRYRILRGGTEIDAVTTAAFQEDAGATGDGTYAYRIVAVDAAGNESAPSAVVTVVVDATVPAQVTGLSGTTPTNGFPALTWTAVPGAARYLVYRDDAVAGEVATTSFNDTTVSDDGSYAYAVSAVDAAGNEGAPSATRTIAVDTSVVGVPSALDADSPTNTAPELSWTGVPGSNVVYTVLRNGAVAGATASASFTDTGLTADGSYAYSVRATDDGGVPSAPSSPVTVVYDTTAPAAPAGLAGTTPTDTAPQLAWTAVAGAVSYELRRDGAAVGTVAGVSFTDAALAADGSYVYTVVATDAAGNVSAASAPATIVVDTTPPAAPAAPTAASPTRVKPALAWAAVTGATSYQVYRGGTYVTTTAATAYTDTGVPGEGAWPYRVVAADGAGNIGPSSPSTTVVYDVTAPLAPTGLTGPALTSVSPTLTWTPVADAVGYGVFRDGTRIATGTAATFTDSALSGDGTHLYAVSAIDAAGNESTPSAPAVGVVRDTVAPARPVGLQAPSPTRTAPEPTWAPVADAARYRVTVDGTTAIEVTQPAATLPSLPADGDHLLRVLAIDAAGNVSAASAPVTVTVDQVAPAVPAGLNGASPTRSGPAVGWPAVAGADLYRVRRDGVLVAATHGVSFTDAIASDGTVAYTVSAVDLAGNESAQSAPLEVRVDLTPPAAPAAPRAASPSSSPVHLDWDAVAGAVGYRVYRDGSALADTAATGLDDGALAADGTHAYAVSALDAVGNESAPGPAASVAVDVTPPPVPAALTATSPTSSQPSLTWTASAGAVSYRILRGGSQAGTSPTPAFQDAVGTDGSYAYTVQAVDAAGNVSAPSAVRSVVFDTTPPAAPTGLAGASPTESSPALTWTPSAGASAYRVLRDGAVAGTGAAAAYGDAQVTASGTYTYAVVAVDAAGNASAPSASRAIEVRFSPNGVVGLAADSPAQERIADLGRRQRHRLGGVAGRCPGRDAGVPAFSDPGVAEGPHRYAVGVAGSGDLEPPSAIDVVVDRTPPAAVTGLTAASPTHLAPALAWTAVADAASYVVTVHGADHAVTSPAYLADAVADGSTTYAVRAVDAAGNRSAPATVDVVVDTVAPDAPVASAVASPTADAPALGYSTGEAGQVRVARDGDDLGAAAGGHFADGTHPADGTYSYRLRLTDAAGNASAWSAPMEIVVDRTAPPAPAVRAAASPTADAPALQWDPVPGAASYVVRRDGAVVGSTAGTSLGDGAAAEGSLAYTVTAVDAAGNASAPSDAVTVVVDRTAPDAPAGVTATSPARKPLVRWDAVADAVRYAIVRDGAVVAEVAGATSSTDEPEAGTHVYAVEALDAAGNRSARSATATADVDLTAPARPDGVVGSGASNQLPWVRWTPVDDAVSYQVSRDGVVVATVTDPEYRPASLPADGSYVFTVTARDAAGNRSAASDPVTVTVDTVPPAAVTGLDAVTPTAGAPSLAWTPVADAVAYRVQRDGDAAIEVTSATFVDGAAGDGDHLYAVVAVDRAGNASPAATTDVLVDRTGPAAPALTADARTRTEPELAIGAVADADRFTIERDGADIATVAAGVLGATFRDTGAGEGTHTYRVRALDALGNPSARSAPAVVAVDRTPPAVPVAPAAASPTTGAPALTWTPAADAGTYVVLRDGSEAAEVADGAFTDAAQADGDHTYRLVAVDAAGNRSDPSSATVVTVDTAPPAAPAGVHAASPTRTAPHLDWSAAADAAGYAVLRDGREIVRTAAPGYDDAGLADDGVHDYAVVAIDAAGNRSAPSAAVPVEFRPGAPIAPAGLAADRTPTNAAPALHWQPVANAAAYLVARDGAVVGRVTGTAFTEGAAPADGIHRYTVAAEGASGLHGEDSDPLDVTVDTVAPDTTIDDAPTGPSGADVTFAFTTAADASGAECRADGGAFAACSSPVHLHLADGDHRVDVRAVDEAGNADPTPAGFDVTVDATPPAAPALTATPDTSLPLGSGQGRVDVHVQAPADAVRVVVRRGATVIDDGPPPAGDLSDDRPRRPDALRVHRGRVRRRGQRLRSRRTPPPTRPTGRRRRRPPHLTAAATRCSWAGPTRPAPPSRSSATAPPIARTTHAAVTDVDAVDDAPPGVARRRRRGRRGADDADAALAGGRRPRHAATATPSTARTRPATSAPPRPSPSSSRRPATSPTGC